MYRFGDILLLKFPFTDVVGVKKRPALVILDTGDGDVLVARVTTKPSILPAHEIELGDWRGAGLLAPSWVKISKLATLDAALVERRLGKLQAEDLAVIRAALQQMLGKI